jgi:hypothetical protein
MASRFVSLTSEFGFGSSAPARLQPTRALLFLVWVVLRLGWSGCEVLNEVMPDYCVGSSGLMNRQSRERAHTADRYL